jgi:hypothetical protein
MKQITSKVDNLLYLLQYLKELRDKNEPYRGSWKTLTETFEIEKYDNDYLLKILKADNIVQSGNNKKNICYFLDADFQPSKESSRVLMDKVYRARKNYINVRKQKRIDESKSSQEKITFTHKVIDMKAGRQMKTLNFNLQNALDQLWEKKTFKGSLKAFLVKWGVNSTEADLITVLLKKDFLKAKGFGRSSEYEIIMEQRPTPIYIKAILFQTKKNFDAAIENNRLKKLAKENEGKYTFPNPNRIQKAIADNKEMYGAGRGDSSVIGNTIVMDDVNDNPSSFRNLKEWIDGGKEKMQSVETIKWDEDSETAIKSPVFATIDFVDRLIDLMTEIMTPEEIVFNTEHRNKFDAEIREKLNLTSSEVEVDLKTYRGLSLIWDASAKTPIQIK